MDTYHYICVLSHSDTYHNCETIKLSNSIYPNLFLETGKSSHSNIFCPFSFILNSGKQQIQKLCQGTNLAKDQTVTLTPTAKKRLPLKISIYGL